MPKQASQKKKKKRSSEGVDRHLDFPDNIYSNTFALQFPSKPPKKKNAALKGLITTLTFRRIYIRIHSLFNFQASLSKKTQLWRGWSPRWLSGQYIFEFEYIRSSISKQASRKKTQLWRSWSPRWPSGQYIFEYIRSSISELVGIACSQKTRSSEGVDRHVDFPDNIYSNTFALQFASKPLKKNRSSEGVDRHVDFPHCISPESEMYTRRVPCSQKVAQQRNFFHLRRRGRILWLSSSSFLTLTLWRCGRLWTVRPAFSFLDWNFFVFSSKACSIQLTFRSAVFLRYATFQAFYMQFGTLNIKTIPVPIFFSIFTAITLVTSICVMSLHRYIWHRKFA